MTKRDVAFAVVMVVCILGPGLSPAASQEEPRWTSTVSVIYWPASVTNQVTLSGNRGSLTGTGSYSQPYLILDYRLVSPAAWGLHLYYAPLLFASTGNTAGGLWGGEVTYDFVLHPTPASLLILDLYAGYGQQNTNSSTTGPLGDPINLNIVTGGFIAGFNAILPVSKEWAFFGGVGYYPWGYANFTVSAPVAGLSTTATASAPQWNYSVGVHYTTPDQWGFSLGYQWATLSISGTALTITTDAGHTLGGTICPCNTSFSGFLFSASKSF